MTGKTPVDRIHALTSEIAQQNTIARELVAKCLDVLRMTPLPDTFLGRRTHEPFPGPGLDVAQVSPGERGK